MAIFLSNYTNNSQLYTDRSFVTELRPETHYPSLNEIVYVLQYLYNNYAQNYEYFLIVSDNTYINMYSFEDVVNELAQEDEELIYAGFSNSFGLHEYCGADSGVLISVQTLSKVIENINNCIGWSKRYSWDVMLGQCLRKTLGIKCMNISQVRNEGREREGEREREGGRGGREREGGGRERGREREGGREREEREREGGRGMLLLRVREENKVNMFVLSIVVFVLCQYD